LVRAPLPPRQTQSRPAAPPSNRQRCLVNAFGESEGHERGSANGCFRRNKHPSSLSTDIVASVLATLVHRPPNLLCSGQWRQEVYAYNTPGVLSAAPPPAITSSPALEELVIQSTVPRSLPTGSGQQGAPYIRTAWGCDRVSLIAEGPSARTASEESVSRVLVRLGTFAPVRRPFKSFETGAARGRFLRNEVSDPPMLGSAPLPPPSRNHEWAAVQLSPRSRVVGMKPS